NKRALALQGMASTLRATLSFERVVEAALDVCSLALKESGIPANTLVGAVLLYENEALVPVTTRGFMPHDKEQRIDGESGLIGGALKAAEPATTHNPQADPELQKLLTFQRCNTVVCIPLRTGFQIFGVMLLGTEVEVEFEQDQFDLFNSVA